MGAEENLLFVSARCHPSGESAGLHLTQHNLPQFTNNNIIHTVAGSSSSSTSILISLFHHPLNQQEEQQQYKDPWTVHTFYTLLTLHHDHGCHLMKCRIMRSQAGSLWSLYQQWRGKRDKRVSGHCSLTVCCILGSEAP